jgi:hypothetical protein
LVHASPVSREEIVMADQPAEGGSFPQDRYKNPETALGGADAVEKTTYVADVHGAEVEAREPPPVPLTATVSSGGGFGALGWAAILLALLAFATYAMGLF